MSAASKTRRVRPGLLRTVWHAWVSTWAAMRDMPLAFLLTAAASVLLAIVIAHLVAPPVVVPPGQEPPAISYGTAILSLLRLLPVSFAYALTLAPLAVAMHRFVVLGERQTLLPLRPLSRVVGYAAWVTLFNACISLPGLIVQTSTPAQTLVVCLTFVVMVATVRLTLLFPQIAVRTAGEPLRTFWAITRWRFWNTATVLVLAMVPVLALQFLIVLAVSGTITAATMAAVSDLPLLSALNAPYVAMGAAAASWLFVGYGLAPGTHEGVPVAPE
jgi:hypothetical protein